MPRLILNADDFGYTPGVNQAILELHRAGALTSTTLMATGLSMPDAVRQALPVAAQQSGRGHSTNPGSSPASSRLGIGCHVVLVDGIPASASGELPTLSVPAQSPATQAHFRPTLGAFVADLVRHRIREGEIEREAVAQIRRLQQQGVYVTHLDTHKHTHMFPGVLRPLLRAALQCGVRAIRNPFEPSWSIASTHGAPMVRRAEVRLLGLLRPTFFKLVTEAGLNTTDGALGVLATGTLDARTLERILRDARSKEDQVWELVCHPGYHDATLAAQNTRLVAAREIERAALEGTVPLLKNFILIHFGSL